MGVCTSGVMSPDITVTDILNAVQKRVDADAKLSDVEIYDCNGHQVVSGYVILSDRTGYRKLHIYTGYCQKEGTPYNETLATQVSLGASGDAVAIIRNIVANFGGYVQDSDNMYNDFYTPYQLLKTDDGTLVQVRNVTMEEVYAQFGEVVRIVDYKNY